jgi:hypothetical protein
MSRNNNFSFLDDDDSDESSINFIRTTNFTGNARNYYKSLIPTRRRLRKISLKRLKVNLEKEARKRDQLFQKEQIKAREYQLHTNLMDQIKLLCDVAKEIFLKKDD